MVPPARADAAAGGHPGRLWVLPVRGHVRTGALWLPRPPPAQRQLRDIPRCRRHWRCGRQPAGPTGVCLPRSGPGHCGGRHRRRRRLPRPRRHVRPGRGRGGTPVKGCPGRRGGAVGWRTGRIRGPGGARRFGCQGALHRPGRRHQVFRGRDWGDSDRSNVPGRRKRRRGGSGSATRRWRCRMHASQRGFSRRALSALFVWQTSQSARVSNDCFVSFYAAPTLVQRNGGCICHSVVPQHKYVRLDRCA